MSTGVGVIYMESAISTPHRGSGSTSVHRNFEAAAAGVLVKGVEISVNPVRRPHSAYIANAHMPVTRTVCFIAYSSCTFRARQAEGVAAGVAVGRTAFSSSFRGIGGIVDGDGGWSCPVLKAAKVIVPGLGIQW